MKKGIKTLFATMAVTGVASSLAACTMPKEKVDENKEEIVIDYTQQNKELKSGIEEELLNKVNKQLPYYLFEKLNIQNIYIENDESAGELIYVDTIAKLKKCNKEYPATFVLPYIKTVKELYSDIKDQTSNKSETPDEEETYNNLKKIYDYFGSLKTFNVNVHMTEFNNEAYDLKEIISLYEAKQNFDELKNTIEGVSLLDFIFTKDIFHTMDDFKVDNITFEEDIDGNKIVYLNGKIQYTKIPGYHYVSFGTTYTEDSELNEIAQNYDNISMSINSDDIFDYENYFVIDKIFNNIRDVDKFYIFDRFKYDGEDCDRFYIENDKYEEFYEKYLLEQQNENNKELTLN